MWYNQGVKKGAVGLTRVLKGKLYYEIRIYKQRLRARGGQKWLKEECLQKR